MKRLLTSVAAAALALGMSGVASAEPIKNVVLVHGAFADGSGWRAVTDILERDGYTVSIVQEPETSLADGRRGHQAYHRERECTARPGRP